MAKVTATDIPSFPAILKVHENIVNSKYKEHEIEELADAPEVAVKLQMIMTNCTQKMMYIRENKGLSEYFKYMHCVGGAVCPAKMNAWIDCAHEGDVSRCSFLKKEAMRCGQKYSQNLLRIFMTDLHRKKHK